MRQHEDKKPWYRQFWPWFILGLPAVVVVASLVTVFIATRHADDLVADEYYKEGLAINKRLERRQLAEDLGISAVISTSGREISATLNQDDHYPRLYLSLSHPLEADRDLLIELHRVAAARYAASLSARLDGKWHWSLEPEKGSGWQVLGEFNAGVTESESGS